MAASVHSKNTQLASAPRSHERPGFYLPELDSLRFFAFAAVFVRHLMEPCPDFVADPRNSGAVKFMIGVWSTGAFGVDLFFVLSAYLITELLVREKEQFGRIDIRSFYMRRVLRIWPLYFTFLVVAYGGLRLYPFVRINGAYFVMCAALLGNFAFALRPASLIIGPLWSVSLEEQFYLTWPLFVRALSRRAVAAAGVLLWIFTLYSRWALIRRGILGPRLWVNTFAHLDPIACGLLLSAFLGASPRHRLDAYRGTLCLVGACLWLAAGFCAPDRYGSGALSVMLAYPAIAIGCAAFLIATIGAGTEHAWTTHRWPVYLGRISYGLYTFHGALIIISLTLCTKLFRSQAFVWLTFPSMALLATVALAAGSYRWLESPFLRMKSRFQHVRSGQ